MKQQTTWRKARKDLTVVRKERRWEEGTVLVHDFTKVGGKVLEVMQVRNRTSLVSFSQCLSEDSIVLRLDVVVNQFQLVLLIFVMRPYLHVQSNVTCTKKAPWGPPGIKMYNNPN